MYGATRGEVGDGRRVPGAERATVVEVFGPLTRTHVKPVLEVLSGMAAGKGDGGTGQGGPGGRGTDGRGEGGATAAAAVDGHRISMILTLPPATVSAIPADMYGATRGEVGDGRRVPGAERATVVEVFGPLTRTHVKPVLEVLSGMAAGKGDGGTGQGGPGGRGTDGRGEGGATAAAAVDGHRISMILTLPPATVSAIPADMYGATRGEVGDGRRVPGAERATVVEVFGPLTRTHVKPVLEVLSGMAAGKGDGGTGQGGPGGRGTDGRGEGGATAAAAVDGHRISMILTLPPATVSAIPADMYGATRGEVGDGRRVPGAERATVVEVFGPLTRTHVKPVLEVLSGMAAGKGDGGTGQGGPGGRGTDGRGEGGATAAAAVDGHRISMILTLPPATVSAIPADMYGATRGEVGDGRRVPGAERATVVEVFGPLTRTHVKPVLEVLSGMAAGKGDGGTGQGGPGGRGTDGRGEGGATAAAADRSSMLFFKRGRTFVS